ncbi:uncharacterized protein K02A2.6-like [Scaptodrosophila lebanonensis]|uniref:Uncharacterized protein K02A2.6-like n=1 Tax=Drosophila lebanonensis TaxID=7225 RepID=A0A6J2U2D1_DROLE|nr:uncharacterized protein K02A2.6-like [Scaptodrosophila lebanonensis]
MHAFELSSTTSQSTIAALTDIFAIEGYPKTLVSDNGPQLTSDTFKDFCNKHGITHITTAPFHPASNGLAERFVQQFKTSITKNIQEGHKTKMAVIKYLASYRFTPNADNKTPAELLHGRPVRTLLSQLFEQSHDNHRSHHSEKYAIDQQVFARNYAKGEKCVEGTIVRSLGKMLYIVNTHVFGHIRRHINELKPRFGPETTEQIRLNSGGIITWKTHRHQQSNDLHRHR